MARKFRILSIDGGGLKGLIAIKILQAVEKFSGRRISDQFHLLAGTSTGGLIVSALACARSEGDEAWNLDQIESLYLDVGKDLFRQGGLSYSPEDVGKFDRLIRVTFGDMTLARTLLPVLVPAYDTVRKELVVFKTRAARSNPAKNVPIAQVCRATTAIPPVFPVYPMSFDGREVRCADAGPFLKNPALSALAEVWKHRHEYAGEELREEDIVLFSVSTGNYRNSGAEWSTDIGGVLHSQEMDMDYISAQHLDIRFDRVKYMRVDMNLGGSPFSLAQSFQWIKRIKDLAERPEFRAATMRLMED